MQSVGRRQCFGMEAPQVRGAVSSLLAIYCIVCTLCMAAYRDSNLQMQRTTVTVPVLIEDRMLVQKERITCYDAQDSLSGDVRSRV